MGRYRDKMLGIRWADKRKMSVEMYSHLKQAPPRYSPSVLMLHEMAIGQACTDVLGEDANLYVRRVCRLVPILFDLEARGLVLTQKLIRTVTGVFEYCVLSDINALEQYGVVERMAEPKIYKQTDYRLTKLAKDIHHSYISIHGSMLGDINRHLSTKR